VTAADGGKWLVLGSFFSGIKMIQLDAATGKPAASPTVYSLASKPFPDPEEGAGITYHDGYYYLFVSVDNCCRGHQQHVPRPGRAVHVYHRPYVDASGTAMTNGGGMEVQGTDAGMIGPGGEFVFTSGGSDWLVYHYYDAFDNGDAVDPDQAADLGRRLAGHRPGPRPRPRPVRAARQLSTPPVPGSYRRSLSGL